MGAGQIVGIVFFAIAFIINIVAVATPAWIDGTILSVSVNTGLFHQLTGSASSTVNREDAENSALAFSILGDISLLIAIAAASFAIATKKKDLVGRLGGIIGIIAAIFLMLGMAIFTGLRISRIDYQFFFWGYSFALGWVSFCLALIGGIAALIV